MKSVLPLARRAIFAGNRPARKTYFSTRRPKWDEKQAILSDYEKLKYFVTNDFAPSHTIDPKQVFAVNQIDFSEMKVFGFDYDYTLAEYSDDMQEFIYVKAADILYKKYKYPKGLLHEPYVRDYCIRGLHYDIKRGLIMKIDERNIVQMDTVRKGREKLKQEEKAELELEMTHVPKSVMDESCFRGSGNLQQLTDIFSLPEMLLLANVVHFFTKNNIAHDPRMVFDAVENAVRAVHTEGHLHKEVSGNVEKYLEKDCLRPLIDKLLDEKRVLFLLTNSKFPCVDVGMKHMLGNNWRDAFEIVMVDAKKPHFFSKTDRPFKTLLLKNTNGAQVSWATIKELQKGEIYCDGCCSELMRLKKWTAREVMYFGDQIYADLQTPSQSRGWNTCAVIHELKHEIDIMNENPFVRHVVWVQTLERLIARMQVKEFVGDSDAQNHVRKWMAERMEYKEELKRIFNPQFGSVFRSALQGSYFSARLCRVADIYTSSVRNLLHCPSDKIFFPPRGSHPHELLVSTGYQHDGFDTALIEMCNKENPKEN